MDIKKMLEVSNQENKVYGFRWEVFFVVIIIQTLYNSQFFSLKKIILILI